MKFYRYRKISSAIPEIENTSFRLAAKSELNDPIEGYLNLYWEGDKAAWEGLLRNYICSLYNLLDFWAVFKDDFDLDYYAVIPDLSDTSESHFKDHVNTVADQFLNDTDTESVVQYLSNHGRVRRETLQLCLMLLHEVAFRLCMAEMKKDGGFAKNVSENYQDMHHAIKALLSAKMREKEELTLFNYVNHQRTSLLESSLIAVKNIHDKDSEKTEADFKYRADFLSIRFDFPRIYVGRLRELVYPKMFIACFSTENDNSVMWGNYADSHKGICLIYESDENNCLEIDDKPQECEDGAEKNFKVRVKLKPVKYGGKIISRNFFESMGRFTQRAVDEWC